MASPNTHVVSEADYEKLRRKMNHLKADLSSFRTTLKPSEGQTGKQHEKTIADISSSSQDSTNRDFLHMRPIGTLCSVYKELNGTPRQPGLCKDATATLTISKHVFNNPEHSLEDLHYFSHVWVLFVFHKNKNSHSKAKVKPPRMDGKKTGVFSTRSPYRPNPIGLSLAKLDKVVGCTLFLSGIDMLDGTPVLDIKPYIPYCDNPEKQVRAAGGDDEEASQTVERENKDVIQISENNSDNQSQEEAEDRADRNEQELDDTQTTKDVSSTTIAPWLQTSSIGHLSVRFTPTAEQDLENFSRDATDEQYKLSSYDNAVTIKAAIQEILQNDPRSAYRRKKCLDRLYYFSVDNVHVTCWFDNEQNVAEVLCCKPQTTDASAS